MMAVGVAVQRGFACRQISRSHRSFKSQNGFPGRKPRQQQDQRQNALFSSQTAYQDPTLEWAQSNPRLAQECLNPPPLAYITGVSAENMMNSFEAYLEWRGWTFPKEISDESQDSDFEDPRENAKALVSHLLSAPLTLASQFKHIIQHCANGNTQDGSQEFDWCCLGARAEASIPIMYWKEFLMSSRASLLSEEMQLAGGDSFPSSKNIEISLDFIGPDIPPKLSEQSIIIPEGQDESHPYVTFLSLRGYHRGYFHDSQAKETSNFNSKLWNAYIFFNPGFGHPNLQKSWEPTLKLILDGRHESTRNTQCAVLLTAHSEHDMARDAEILSSAYGLKDIMYHENPFASRIAYEDPFEKNHFVRPNHYVASVVI